MELDSGTKVAKSPSVVSVATEGVREIIAEYGNHATIHGVAQLRGPRIYNHRK